MDYEEDFEWQDGYYWVVYEGWKEPDGPFPSILCMADALGFYAEDGYPGSGTGYVVFAEKGEPFHVPSINPDDLLPGKDTDA